MPKQPSYTVLPTHGPGWFRAGLSLCRLTLFRALISRNPNTRAPTTKAAIELSAERILHTSLARPRHYPLANTPRSSLPYGFGGYLQPFNANRNSVSILRRLCGWTSNTAVT